MTIERDEHGTVIGTTGPDHVYDAMEPGETYATSELVQLVDADVTQQTLRNWLHQLHNDGHVEMRKPNNQLILWWRTPTDE